GRSRVPFGTGPVTIGRNFTNLLVIEEAMASRFHCVIDRTDEGFRLRDLDSRNGTKVNGQVVKAAILSQGDVVQIGSTQIKVVSGTAPVANPPAPSKAPRPVPKAAQEEEAAADEFAGMIDEGGSSAAPDLGEFDEGDEEANTDGIGGDWRQILHDRAESLPNR